MIIFWPPKFVNTQQREVRDQRRQQLKRKAEEEGEKHDNSKIAALEAKLQEQERVIASLRTVGDDNVKIPPRPKTNPLKPPAGFAQRGE